MKRFLDFVLSEETLPDSELILRIHPMRSRCHVFDPKKQNKTIRDIYKTYMYWRILRRYRNEDGTIEQSKVMFDSSCDECSILVEGGLRYILKGILYKRPTDIQSLLPMGDGVSWEIKRVEMDRSILDDDDMDEEEKAEHIRLVYFDPYCIGYVKYKVETHLTLELDYVKPWVEAHLPNIHLYASSISVIVTLAHASSFPKMSTSVLPFGWFRAPCPYQCLLKTNYRIPSIRSPSYLILMPEFLSRL